jgi:hypothetical protein
MIDSGNDANRESAGISEHLSDPLRSEKRQKGLSDPVFRVGFLKQQIPSQDLRRVFCAEEILGKLP